MITINVTQHHIDSGVHGDPEDCPIAQAIKDRLKGVLDVRVCLGSIRMVYLKQEQRYEQIIHTPAIVQSFIETFDHRGKVVPFTFSILNLL